LERGIIKGKIQESLQYTAIPGSEATELGHGLTTYRWLSYRTLWLTTSEGVILFDPLNRAASADIAARLAKAGQPLRYVIYSHGHRDHTSGADALGGHPIVLAHRRTAEDIRLRRYADVVPPTETFDEDEHVLTLGGEEIRLIRIAGAHTDALVVSYLPSRRVLYAVDLVWPNQLPPPGAPLSYSGVERALDRILELDFDTFVPGHGAVTTKQEVARYRAFLADLRKEFAAALERRGLSDLHSEATYLAAPQQIGSVFFEVIDKLQPKYGDWENFDSAILPTVQWCFWSTLTGD
jgi:glyoxylase-like metal-dependent hydrolase (beta-lactamase superfamily II)